MLLGKRLFPYPVLNAEKVLSNYSEDTFEVKYKGVQGEDDYIFQKAHYILTNAYLQSLIDDGKARCVLFVECSSTRFRKLYDLSLEPKDIKIPLAMLNDRITVSGYVIATQDIEPFKPTGLDSFYDGFDEFFVEAHDVLALDEYVRIKINYDVEDDNLTSSIFTIVGDSEITDGSIRTEVTKKKIMISMSKGNYASYIGIKDIEESKWLPFAIMLVPALAMAFEKTKEGGRKPLEDIAFEYDWFMSVQARFKKANEREMNEDDYYGVSSYELAQQMLDMASSKALDTSFYLISKGSLD